MLIFPLTAILSAVLLTLSMAPYDFYFLAPFSLLPFFAALALSARFEFGFKREFLASWFFAFLFHLFTIWWISYVSVAGMLAVSIFLAFLMALFLALGVFLTRKGTPFCLALSGALLLYELLVSYLFTGFPWLSFGYALHKSLIPLQSAEIWGVHGLSFALVFLQAAFAAVICKGSFRKALGGIISAAFLWLLIFAFGAVRIYTLEKEAPQRTISAALVQLNLPPELKHDPSQDEQTLEDYLAQMRQLALENPDVIIWPETGVPGIYNDLANPACDRLRLLRREIKIPLLSGLSWAVKQKDGEVLFYNAAALLDNALMEPKKMYWKKHLVIFGEYVPLMKWLPFLKFLTPIAGYYSPGDRSHALPLELKSGAKVWLGALICFEDVFPEEARKAVTEGADILVNITNDGWFWGSPGPYQHAALARFRAVENRRALVRSANTGVSVAYDRLGREKEVLEKEGKRVLIKGNLLCQVDIFAAVLTFYNRCGDWPLLALGLLLIIPRRRIMVK